MNFAKLRRHGLPLVALALLTLCVFGRVVGHQFLAFDDGGHVFANPHLNPPALNQLSAFWLVPFHRPEIVPGQIMHPYEQLYAPLTFTAYAAIASVGQAPTILPTPTGQPSRLRPSAFHLANLVVHGLNVLALYFLLFVLVESRSAAFLGAATFAVHPTQVEAVAWVTQLNTLLSAFFAILALWLVMRAMRPPLLPPLCGQAHPERARSERARFVRLMTFASVVFLLSLLSKPVSVILPAVVWVLCRTGTSKDRLLAHWMLAWLPLAGLFVVVNQRLQPPSDTALFVPLPLRLFQVGDALSFYLFRVFDPLNPIPDYGRTSHYVLAHWWGYCTWALVAALLTLAWSRRRQRPLVWSGLVIFLMALTPTSGVVAYYWHWYSTVADRYAYLAMAGVACIVAEGWCGLRELPSPQLRRGCMVGAGIVVSCWSALSWADCGNWRNDYTLWSNNARLNPDSFLALQSLGNAYNNAGLLPQALKCYEAALASTVGKKDFAGDTEYNLGLLMGKAGRFPEAVQALLQASRLAPADTEVMNSLAVAFMRNGEPDLALARWQRALRLAPTYREARYNYGMGLALTHRLPEAIEQWSLVAREDPANKDVRVQIAQALDSEGDRDAALAEWREVLRLDPGNSGAREALDGMHQDKS